MKNSIVVIGGGQSQLPFIKAMLKSGYKPIVFDKNEKSPAKYVADKFFAVSTHDSMQVLEILKPYQDEIASCFTYSSYVGALQTTALINDIFALPGLRGEALELCLSKSLFRKRCAGTGVRCPEAKTFSSVSEAFGFLKEKVNVIVKPAVGACGSDGVSYVRHNNNQLQEKFAYAARLSENGQVVLEEYIDGLEYSIDGYVHDNTVSVLLVSRKYSLGPAHGFAIDGFFAGSNVLPAEQKKVLCESAIRCVAALKLNNSFFSFDVISKGNNFYYIDYGCLLDAKIDVMLDFVGFDVYSIPAFAISGNLLALKLNEVVNQDLALRLIYAKKSGRIKVLDSDGLITKELGEDVRFFLSEGDSVSPPQSVSDSLGAILGAGPNAAMLWRTQWAIDLVNNVVIE